MAKDGKGDAALAAIMGDGDSTGKTPQGETPVDIQKLKDQIRAEVLAGLDIEGIKAELLAKARVEMEISVAELEQNRAVLASQKKYKIVLHEQDNQDDPRQQLVGCNGVQWVIMRGKEAVVPEGIVNVLRESIYTKTILKADGTRETKEVPRFAFSILGEVAA